MTSKRLPHPISQSPFYRLQSKSKLAKLLFISTSVLQSMSIDKKYNLWSTKPKYPAASHPALRHKPRDIQSPRGPLKDAQKRLNALLSRLDMPEYLHSARKGRSYRTNANAHDGPGKAFAIDIRKFYQSARDAYVNRFFRDTLECSPDVAHCLTEIACYERFLPTGSSMSPIISFLAYAEMFEKLHAVAQSANLVMTVYVDDIVMSGSGAAGQLIPVCKRILKDYGLRGHKIQQFGEGQTRVVTGVGIGPAGLGIPNKRMLKIRALLQELNATKDPVTQRVYKNALLGQLREGSPLDRSFPPLASAVAQIALEPMPTKELKAVCEVETDKPPWD